MPLNGVVGTRVGGAASVYAEYGDTGLKRYGGVVQEEFLPELQGARGIKVYKEMSENDAIVSAMLYAVETICRRVQWRVRPGSEATEDRAWADFITSCMHDMSTSWGGTLTEILTEFTYGWAYLEKVFKIRGGDSRDPKYKSKYSDGKIGWRKMPLRSQDSLYEWELDDRGGIHGMYQMGYPNFEKIYVPISKSLLFRTTVRKNSPEGHSLLRGAYRSYYFKKQIEVFEAIGVERDLAGIPVAEIPAEYMAEGAAADQKTVFNSFKKLVANIRRDEQAGFVMPQAWNEQGTPMFKVYLMTAAGEKQINTDEIIKRYDQRIAMTILADLILIGHVQLGSYALMDRKISMFSRALDSFMDDIADIFNMHAIPELIKLNGGAPAVLPLLTHSPVEEVSLRDLSDFINKLVGSKVITPTEEMERHLLDVSRLPQKLTETREEDAERPDTDA